MFRQRITCREESPLCVRRLEFRRVGYVAVLSFGLLSVLAMVHEIGCSRSELSGATEQVEGTSGGLEIAFAAHSSTSENFVTFVLHNKSKQECKVANARIVLSKS